VGPRAVLDAVVKRKIPSPCLKNRVLKRIFGPKREEVVRHWRELHSEELYGLYPSSIIIKVVKSRSMKWAGP
jgi:hypothetical protein